MQKMESKKICTNCKKLLPLENFRGKINQTSSLKLCQHCRDRIYTAALKRKREPELCADTHAICSVCRKILEKEEFGTNVKTGDIFRTCPKCRDRNKLYRKQKIEQDPEKFRADQKALEKRRHAKRKADPEKWSMKLQENKLYYHKKQKGSDSRYFSAMKAGAKQRGYVLDVQEELVYALRKFNCYYCDAEGPNGIDRYDNSLGYVSSNCVPCCAMCNRVKLDRDVDGFLMLVGHISAYAGKLGRFCYNLLPVSHSPESIFNYVHDAKRKNREMEMSQELFDEVRKCCCYLCGRDGPNGIDRIDSSKGYIKDNIASCCYACNLAKNKFNRDEFINHCEKFFLHCEFYLDLNNVYDRKFKIFQKAYVK